MPHKSRSGKLVPIDLQYVIKVTGIEKGELAVHVDRDPKTIDNWIKKGKVTERDYELISEFVKQHSHHWLWRFDDEETSNWVIKQGISLLREALIAEGEERENKLGLVITICDASHHPLTGEPFEHVVSERFFIDVMKARALYFSRSRSKEGETLYLSLSKEAEAIISTLVNDDNSAPHYSRLYKRAAIEARLGQIVMLADMKQYNYEQERDALRSLAKIVEDSKESAGSFIYPELLAKIYWNEANCHCENGDETVKYADLPIQGLLKLHSQRLVLGLINKDKTVKKVLDVPLIAELLGYVDTSVA